MFLPGGGRSWAQRGLGSVHQRHARKSVRRVWSNQRDLFSEVCLTWDRTSCHACCGSGRLLLPRCQVYFWGQQHQYLFCAPLLRCHGTEPQGGGVVGVPSTAFLLSRPPSRGHFLPAHGEEQDRNQLLGSSLNSVQSFSPKGRAGSWHFSAYLLCRSGTRSVLWGVHVSCALIGLQEPLNCFPDFSHTELACVLLLGLCLQVGKASLGVPVLPSG